MGQSVGNPSMFDVANACFCAYDSDCIGSLSGQRSGARTMIPVATSSYRGRNTPQIQAAYFRRECVL